MDKFIVDEKIHQELEKRIKMYNLEDKDTEEDIIDTILTSEDYKAFCAFKNPTDDSCLFTKKSLAVEHFRKKKPRQ